MTHPALAPPDLAGCENEPIHAPGAIQPHGVLLVLEPEALTVRHASANWGDLFGVEPTALMGSRVGELLGPAAEAALRDFLRDGKLDEPRPVPAHPAGAGGWHCLAHRKGELVFLELEPAGMADASPLAVLAAVRGAVGRLSAATSISDLCSTAAREFRTLTGYDRVMVYQFDAEWNGQVLAEEKRADLEPYLGLRYPASDIPRQARALYLANRVRVIPDAVYRPVPVVPDRDGQTGESLDLGGCLLRSVSPIHLEYLHNMGVRATLTASLIVGGRLWGLISCHELTPKRLAPAEREACDLLAQVISAYLATRAEAEDQAYRVALAEVLSRTGARVGGATPPVAALTADVADLLALVGATGSVVWRFGRGAAVGRTPPAEALPGLVNWARQANPAPQVVTDRLATLYPPAAAFADAASGLLALEVSREADEYVLWFRPEVLQTVTWGGDPNGTKAVDGRLSPRRSFAAWRETVRGQSLPWRPVELEAAVRLRGLLQAAAARSAARLEALLPICAWCKKVRDEPGYWRGVEEFIRDLVDVRFTHGVCPECLKQQLAALAGRRPPG